MGLDSAPAHIIPIGAAPPTFPHRDFVPWRFSDAGRRSAWLASWVPASENLRKTGLPRCKKGRSKLASRRDATRSHATLTAIQRLGGMTDAAAGVHRGARERGGVAARGAGAAGRPRAAHRRLMGGDENDPVQKSRLS